MTRCLGASVLALGLAVAGFAQGLSDAEMVAIEYVEKTTASAELVGKVETMLAAARARVPRVASIGARLAWIPGRMVLRFSHSRLPRPGDGTRTGIGELDHVLAQFGVRSLVALGPPTPDRFTAELDPHINLEEVASTFLVVPGVEDAFPEYLAVSGDGDDISLHKDGVGYRLVFSHGWGDCLAGCTGYHRWSFRFSGGGELLGVDEEGDPLPDGATAPGVGEGLPGRRPPREGVETRD